MKWTNRGGYKERCLQRVDAPLVLESVLPNGVDVGG